MSLQRMIADADGRSLLVRAEAKPFVRGAVTCEDTRGDWVRPVRFAPRQVRSLGSCQAWHPGLYRQMARATAGVSLVFSTNASQIALEVAIDDEPTVARDLRMRVEGSRAEGTRAEGSRAKGSREASGGVAPGRSAFDGIACEVDGQHLAPSWGEELTVSLDADGADLGKLPAGARLVSFVLDDPATAPGGGVQMLPGFGPTRRVRLWLPCLRGVRVRALWGDGTGFDAVPERPVLLVLGDGPAQGLACGDPSFAWPAQLASRLGCDLINQSLHRQVFQPGMLAGIGAIGDVADVAGVVVSLGATYRRERCAPRLAAADVRTFLAELARVFPDVPTWVLTPLWLDEARVPAHPGSCIADLESMLAANVAAHDGMELVDGSRLIDHHAELLADGEELPGSKGMLQIARRLEKHIRTSPLELRG